MYWINKFTIKLNIMWLSDLMVKKKIFTHDTITHFFINKKNRYPAKGPTNPMVAWKHAEIAIQNQNEVLKLD